VTALVIAPRPPDNAPDGSSLLHGHRNHRFLNNRLTLLLERERRGGNHIRAIGRDDDVPRVADRDSRRRDFASLGERLKVA
jgi:hypothetical protein